MSTENNNSETPIDKRNSVRNNLNKEPIQHTDSILTDTWVGNQMSETKPKNTLRIIFQNLNGIGTTSLYENMAALLSEQIPLPRQTFLA